MLSEPKKISTLIRIFCELHFQINEMAKLLEILNPEWIIFPQTEEEIRNQLHREYGLWRGLGTAIAKYLEYLERHNV